VSCVRKRKRRWPGKPRKGLEGASGEPFDSIRSNLGLILRQALLAGTTDRSALARAAGGAAGKPLWKVAGAPALVPHRRGGAAAGVPIWSTSRLGADDDSAIGRPGGGEFIAKLNLSDRVAGKLALSLATTTPRLGVGCERFLRWRRWVSDLLLSADPNLYVAASDWHKRGQQYAAPYSLARPAGVFFGDDGLGTGWRSPARHAD
jgi:hypothetical protein